MATPPESPDLNIHALCVEQGECVEIETSSDDQSEHMKVDHFLAKSCGTDQAPWMERHCSKGSSSGTH